MRIRSLLPLVVVIAAACARKEAPAPVGPNVVTIVATDYAFAVPETLPPGLTTFRLANVGAEPHHAVLVKLAEGKTLADFQAAMMSPTTPDWMSFPGSPAAIMPNDTSNATTQLEPGQYILVCFVPAPDGMPHVAKGMARPFVVAGAAPVAAAAEPQSDVTVTLSDYAFAFSTPLTAGTHTLRVENAGPQLHEIAFERLADGKTLADYVAWGKKPQGPPPATSLGGLIGPMKGSHAFTTVTLAPGKYLVVCHVPDEKDQKSHAEHGMIQEIVIN
ncbi:MAG TPA: hypothetical protein VJU16_09030 [Planctomycetota bacterium]|nr:hypothetical protein [Planctomycetota bacterium]